MLLEDSPVDLLSYYGYATSHCGIAHLIRTERGRALTEPRILRQR